MLPCSECPVAENRCILVLLWAIGRGVGLQLPGRNFASVNWVHRVRRGSTSTQVWARRVGRGYADWLLSELIESRNQPRCAGAISIVFVAKLRSQQPFLGLYARDERRDKKCCEQQADSRTKCQAPAERVDEQA